MNVSRLALWVCVGAVLWTSMALSAQAPVLKQMRDGSIGQGHTFADTAGGIWFESGSFTGKMLYKWTGRWEKTPIRDLPRPAWRGKGAEPWADWARPMHVLRGDGGALLAISVRDIYQNQYRDGSATEISAVPARYVGKRAYWLEAWLLRDGQWVGPTEVGKLLREQRAFLAKHFTRQTPETGHFDLASDGTNLWAAYGGFVLRYNSAGELATAKLSDSTKLPLMNLALLGDGAMWCMASADSTASIWSIAVKDDELAPQTVPGAAFTRPESTAPPCFHVSLDKQVWLWHPQLETGLNTDSVFLWQDGRWQRQSDLGRLCFEEPNGTMWFMPGVDFGRGSATPGYRRLSAQTRSILPWPAGVSLGMVSAARPDLLLAACDDRIISLTPAESGWKIDRTWQLGQYTEMEELFLDGQGHIIGSTGWVAELPK